MLIQKQFIYLSSHKILNAKSGAKNATHLQLKPIALVGPNLLVVEYFCSMHLAYSAAVHCRI